jgi:predicted PurR-regulated permease PerM
VGSTVWRHNCKRNGVPGSFASRATIAISIAIALAGLALIVWRTADIFVLVFVAVLMAVFLRTISDFIRDNTLLPDLPALLATILLVGGSVALSIRLIAPSIAAQAVILTEKLPLAIEELRRYPGVDAALPSLEQLAPLAPRLFTTTLGAGVSLIIILAVGLYLSINPVRYKAGVLALFPKSRRARASEVLDAIGRTLRLWLLGKMVGMAFVGVATTLGLWALGHPLAFTLGLLAGLLDFIPNFGPLIAFIPAVLISLLESPLQALYVVILYAVVQSMQSYLIEPWMHQRNVQLPAALTIAGQVFFGILLGFLGLLVATPLLAVVIALVRELYHEPDVEDEAPEEAGRAKASPEPKAA